MAGAAISVSSDSAPSLFRRRIGRVNPIWNAPPIHIGKSEKKAPVAFD